GRRREGRGGRTGASVKLPRHVQGEGDLGRPTGNISAPSGKAPTSGFPLSALRSGSNHSTGSATPASTARLAGRRRPSGAPPRGSRTNFGSANRSLAPHPGL